LETLLPQALLETLLTGERRVLLFGQPGVGKSVLAAQLARTFRKAGRPCACISADPGLPAFGVPGALSLARWQDDAWEMLAIEALCTLDAGRFRLPLVDALRRLLDRAPAGTLLIDGPGVVRGVAGAELLVAIAGAAGVDLVLALLRTPNSQPLASELAAADAELVAVPVAAQAHRPGKRARARSRTRLWDAYLEQAKVRRVPFTDLRLLGTPPPAVVSEDWRGRQVALLDSQHLTAGLGEVLDIEAGALVLRMPPLNVEAVSLLVRDARRGEDGLLYTAAPAAPGTHWYTPPPDMLARAGTGVGGGPRPVLRLGAATVSLVNGVFGDPLLHLRLRHQKRSLLFDLGEAARLPARIAHQVTDVFISHAHFDHIAGFLWLLRSRIGVTAACRVFGPPGLTENIQGLVTGILWDRIGERGPRFEVTELRGRRLSRYRVQAGRSDPVALGEVDAGSGVLLEDPGFCVRAVTLDHGTPVLAFAFEPPRAINIRKDRLLGLGLPVGPWLGELKRCVAEDKPWVRIRLPDGRTEQAGPLAAELVLVTPGKKLVYATDFADMPANRARLTGLAEGAHTFFCEAVFLESDARQAANTGHLTARACGELGTAAAVERLVPFHFSKRYEGEPAQIYDEVRAACPRTLVPKWRDAD
jgi:ribonuclease BN (tRNA processing enzyme)